MRSKQVFDKRSDKLYSKLSQIYEEILNERKIDVFGNLDFEIVDKIDNKPKRIAKLKGRKIFVKVNAVKLPKSALKYIIAHEIVHTITKGHTKKYWKLVSTIYPNFERGHNLLLKHEGVLSQPLSPRKKFND